MCMYAYTGMATKNVSLSEEAYDSLSRLKEEEESFSDVVKRVTEQYADLSGFSGNFPELAEVREELREERDTFETRNRV